jgi:PST family polysaccharide transporter
MEKIMNKKEDMLSKGLYGMTWLTTASILEDIVNLAITVVLARILDAADYGEMAAIAVLVGFADLFWQLGVGPAIVQKKNLTEDDKKTAFTINILLGIVIFLIINIFSGFWVNVFKINSIVMLNAYSTVFLLNSIMAVPLALLQRQCKFKDMAVLRVTSGLIYGFSAILMAYFGFGPWALVFSNIISCLYKTIVVVVFEKFKVGFALKKETIKKLLNFGGGFTLARIFNYIANNGDYFVVNRTMGKIELGNYTKAYNLLLYPVNLIGSTMDQVLFPILSREQENKERLKKVYLMGMGLIAFCAMPITIILFFCSEEIVAILLGDKWFAVVAPLKILLLGLFFRTAYKLSDSLMRALGKIYQRALIQLFYALSVVMGTYFGHFYGLRGVSIGVTISIFLNYTMMLVMSMILTEIKTRSIISVLLPSIIYGSIEVLALFFIKPTIIQIGIINNFVICIIIGILGLVGYILLYCLTGKLIFVKDQKEFIDNIINLFVSKIRKLK